MDGKQPIEAQIYAEEFLAVLGQMQQWSATRSTAEWPQWTKKQHECFYTNKPEDQRRQTTPCIQ